MKIGANRASVYGGCLEIVMPPERMIAQNRPTAPRGAVAKVAASPGPLSSQRTRGVRPGAPNAQYFCAACPAPLRVAAIPSFGEQQMSGARLGRFLGILLIIAGSAGVAYAVTYFGGVWL